MSFFLVIGMHRSGTSCLAGSLNRCGVHLGNVRKTRSKFNKKGYYELKSIQDIHDQILALHKSNWSNPPENSINIHPYHYQKIQNEVDSLSNHKPCGMKDPRTLLFLDSWQSIIGQDCQLIGTFRHPMEVAKSLNKRNGMSIAKGLELWKHYNSILVETHNKGSFPIIKYDMYNTNSYYKKILRIATNMGLSPNKLSLRSFISSNLQHHLYINEPVPTSCKFLYEYLEKNEVG